MAACRRALTNILVAARLSSGRSIPRAAALIVLLVDVVLLAALIELTGGPFNPFSVVYAIYVVLAVVTLGRGPGGIVGAAALSQTTSIVVLTGCGSISTAVESMKAGAATYLTKPVDADQIVAAFVSPGAASEPPQTVPSLPRVEWEHIPRVLADCEGNVSPAARLLGIHRRSLQRKLAKDPSPEA